MYKQSIHCETCKGLLPLCGPCQRKVDDELERRREKYKAKASASPEAEEASMFDVCNEINKATERYCYHSVFAVWLAHHLATMDSEYSKEIERAIRDTNRTFEKLKANG